MSVLNVIGTAGFATWMGSLCDSMAVGISVFIGTLWMLGGNPAPKEMRKGISLTSVVLSLIGCVWVLGNDDD